MKTNSHYRCCFAFLLLLAAVPTWGQGLAFTYQGVLSQSGAAVNGSNDLTFTLYDAANGGNAVGASNVVNDLAMTNGLFTVTLDFGVSAFNGSARWLQIATRPGASTGAYTPLTPRQPITPTPYAITASNLSGTLPATQLTGTLPDARLSGNVSLLGASVDSAEIADGSIVNADISPSAAIADTKLATISTTGKVADSALSANVSKLGANIDSAEIADGSITTNDLNATLLDGTFWKLGGNTGAIPTNGIFLGTTDLQPLEFKVNNQRGLRIQPSAGAPSLIGGSAANMLTQPFAGSVIGGGGGDGTVEQANIISANNATIGGGLANVASGPIATIGGGKNN